MGTRISKRGASWWGEECKKFDEAFRAGLIAGNTSPWAGVWIPHWRLPGARHDARASVSHTGGFARHEVRCTAIGRVTGLRNRIWRRRQDV